MDEDEAASPFSFIGDAGSGGGGDAGCATGSTAGDGWESTPPTAGENGRGWEMVAVGTSAADYDDCSIFPPTLHEGLHLRPDPDLNPTLAPPLQHPDGSVGGLGESPSPPTMGEEEEEEEEKEMSAMQRRVFVSARRLIGSGLEVINSKICVWRGEGLDRGIRGGVWSVAALAGFVGALMYLRRRHRREKELLMLLIQEKDQDRSTFHPKL